MNARSERPFAVLRYGFVALVVSGATLWIGDAQAQQKDQKKDQKKDQAKRDEDRPRRDRPGFQRGRPDGRRPGSRPGRGRGNSNSPRGKLSAIARGRTEAAKVGVFAPEMHLPLLKGSLPPAEVPSAGGKIKLSDYRGKKPVVLIFGSYT